MDIANIVSISISALSLALSLFITIRTFIKERESYTVDIVDYKADPGILMYFMICVINKSDSPLTITEVRYGEYLCTLESVYVKTGVDSPHSPWTPNFPLCIPAHGAQYAYLAFEGVNTSRIQLDPGTTVTLQVRTTRSTSDRSITLRNTKYYLHRNE